MAKTSTSFKKGQSGNPKGRPRELGEVKELARQYTTVAIEALVQIASHGEKEAARVAAASAILDRAWGKPEQAVQLSGDVSISVTIGVKKPE